MYLFGVHFCNTLQDGQSLNATKKNNEIWQYIFKILDFKNHWTNTRLVCTHLNAFVMPDPNVEMKIQIFEIFDKN